MLSSPTHIKLQYNAEAVRGHGHQAGGHHQANSHTHMAEPSRVLGDQRWFKYCHNQDNYLIVFPEYVVDDFPTNKTFDGIGEEDNKAEKHPGDVQEGVIPAIVSKQVTWSNNLHLSHK